MLTGASPFGPAYTFGSMHPASSLVQPPVGIAVCDDPSCNEHIRLDWEQTGKFSGARVVPQFCSDDLVQDRVAMVLYEKAAAGFIHLTTFSHLHPQQGHVLWGASVGFEGQASFEVARHHYPRAASAHLIRRCMFQKAAATGLPNLHAIFFMVLETFQQNLQVKPFFDNFKWGAELRVGGFCFFAPCQHDSQMTVEQQITEIVTLNLALPLPVWPINVLPANIRSIQDFSAPSPSLYGTYDGEFCERRY